MKNTMKLMASLSLAASLVACGPAPTAPKPSNSSTQSAAPTAAPTATPTAAPTAAPTATPTAAPPTATPTVAPLPTIAPDPNAAFSLGTASATKNPNFSYTVTITGTGWGTLADYKFFQVKFSEATIPLIVDGQSKEGLELSNVTLTPTELKFTFKFANPPVASDMIQLTFEKTGQSGAKSTEIRLTSVTN